MIECLYFGEPTIPQKENHLIYRYRFQKRQREASKSFYEVDFSAHKDCLRYEIWEEFEKVGKDLSKYKRPIFSYCYVYRGNGSWTYCSIVPTWGDEQEVLNKRKKDKGVA